MALFWTPPDEVLPHEGRFVHRSLLRRCLVISGAAHALAAVAAPWLSLSVSLSPREERLLVRTVDFVVPEVPAPAARPVGETRAPSGSRASSPPAASPRSVATPAPRRAAALPRAPVKPEPARTPAPVPTRGPAPPPASEVGDLPAPPPPDPRLAASPKAIGGATARSAAPAAIGAPSRSGPAAGSAVSDTVPGAAVEVGGGPVATVSIPRDLARSAGGGAGTGAGDGAAGGGAAGGGTAAVDTRDPDFSEYFRLIERRVRAVWRFPDALGGSTQTVKIGFALGPEGSLRDARVLSSTSGALDESALSAMKRAAPFPPLPEKFRSLAGQPLVMGFTVTIR